MNADDKFFFSATAGYVDHDSLYTVDTEKTFFVKYDLNSMSYKILSYDALWNNGKARPVLDIFKIEQSFFFTMIFCDNVIEYDTTTGKAYEYGEDTQSYSRSQNLKSFLFGNLIWILPQKIGGDIRIFNYRKKCFEKNRRLNVRNALADRNFTNLIMENEMLWFCDHNSPFIYSYNLITDNEHRYDVGDGFRIDDFFYSGGKFFLTQIAETVIYEWNKDDGIFKRYPINCMSITKGHLWLSDLFFINNMIIGMSCWRDRLFIFDLQTDIETGLDFPKEYRRIGNTESSLFRCVIPHKDDLLILPSTMDGFIHIKTNGVFQEAF